MSVTGQRSHDSLVYEANRNLGIEAFSRLRYRFPSIPKLLYFSAFGFFHFFEVFKRLARPWYEHQP